MGRVSKKQADQNRKDVVSAASRLFKERGLGNAGIDDLMAEVGLTRGSFYKMFGTKEQLAAEACGVAFENAENAWSSLKEGDHLKLEALARYYLEPKAPAQDCPMVTISEDVARLPHDDPQRDAFTNGFKRLAGLVEGEKPGLQHLTSMATLVGARILARSINDDDLSKALVSAVIRDLTDKT